MPLTKTVEKKRLINKTKKINFLHCHAKAAKYRKNEARTVHKTRMVR